MAKTEKELRDDFERYAERENWSAWLIVAALVMEAYAAWYFSTPDKPWYETAFLIAANLLIAAGVYGEIRFGRKADTVGKALQQISDEKIADLTRQAAEANQKASEAEARASEANVQVAKANIETEILRFQLDQEIQKRAPRLLTPEQKSVMLDELRGKIPEIAIVVQNDIKAQAFAVQFFILFHEAGAKMYSPETPREDKWYAPSGLMMYSPLGTNLDILKDDPLYRALKRADLFGGTMNGPFGSGQPRWPTISILGYNGPVLYIGQKSPF